VAFAIKRPHLSVVWLLKNLSGRLCRSLSLRRFRCSGETRLCRAFSVSSTVCRNFFLPAGAAKLLQPQPPPTPQPAPLLRLQCGLCCEGANIRPDSKGAQAFCHQIIKKTVKRTIRRLRYEKTSLCIESGLPAAPALFRGKPS